jgi:hypothetical protein
MDIKEHDHEWTWASGDTTVLVSFLFWNTRNIDTIIINPSSSAHFVGHLNHSEDFTKI